MSNRNTNGFPNPVTPDRNSAGPGVGWVKVNGDWVYMPDRPAAPTRAPQDTFYDNAPVQQPAYRQRQENDYTEEPYDNPYAAGGNYGSGNQNAARSGGNYSYFARKSEPSVDREPTQYIDINGGYEEEPQGQAYTNYNSDINRESDYPPEDPDFEEDPDYEEDDDDTSDSNKKMMITMIVLLVALLAMVTIFIVSYFKSDNGNVAEGFQNLFNVGQEKEDTEQYTLGDEQKTAVNRTRSTTTTTRSTSSTTTEKDSKSSSKSSSTTTKKSSKPSPSKPSKTTPSSTTDFEPIEEDQAPGEDVDEDIGVDEDIF